ncbi:MAG: sulfatase-like hydrolase/transferase [Planctomycetota bacterium]
MNRRTFLRSVGAGAAAMSLPGSICAGAARAGQPNLLFIFADDQCFETIRAFGCDEIHTPNLDRLVRSGTTFTHAYNMGSWTGAVCVASRTMLNTGLFLWHARRAHGKLDREFRQKGRMWGQLMGRAGYETYFTGKWHVRADAGKTFDHVTHVRPGMPNQTPQGYSRPVQGKPDPWDPWDRQYGGYWKGGTHWSEVLGDDATRFLRRAAGRDEPFFMYLAFNAPHDPRQSPKAYVNKYPLDQVAVPPNYLPEYPFKDAIGCGKGLRDEKLAPFPRTEYAVKVHRQEYYAIITHMDHQIGRILDALEKSGKAANTYVFFSADHGLAVGHHGLMGKQNLYDHSVRVPLVVVGPGIAAGKRIDATVYLQDIMPTTLDLAGVAKPDHVQFRSLVPLLAGKAEQSYDAVYGAYLNLQRMVTDDGWKLLLYPRIKKVRLYHLADDPLEMKDLAGEAKYRPVIRRLFARLLELQKPAGDSLDLRAAFPDL